MPQPTYQQGAERPWWWKVAEHLDSAHLASINAMAHNVDSQELVLAFQDKVREAQVLLLEIFRTKGLLPGAPPAERLGPPGPPAPVAPPPPAPSFTGVQAPPEIEEAARDVAPIEAAVVIVDQSELEASEKAAAYEAAIAATPAPPGPPAPPAPPVRDVTR